MDNFNKRSTSFTQYMEVDEILHETDYSRMVSEKTAHLELRNKKLAENNEKLQKLQKEAEDAHLRDHKEIVYLKGHLKSLQKNLENKTRTLEELEVVKNNQNEQKKKLAQLEYEKKQMKKETQNVSSNLLQLTDEIGKLNQEKQNNRDGIKQLNAHIKVVEKKLLEQEQIILEEEETLKKMNEKDKELTKYVSELSMKMEELHESKKILQEKLDVVAEETTVLRQQNFSNSSHFTIPHNSLMHEIMESEKAAQEERKARMAMQLLNAEDTTQQEEDETSCQGESRNLFDLKMPCHTESFYSRMLATMVAVMLIVIVLLSIYISSNPSCNIESQAQIYRESLQSFLVHIVWHYWGIYHVELPPQ